MIQKRKTTKTALTEKQLQGVKYFFSLALEDYFGDKEELMRMADVDEKLLRKFLYGLAYLNKNK